MDQVLVVPPDYLATGALRRYERSAAGFTSGDRAPGPQWLVRSLLAGHADSLVVERVARPSRGLVDCTTLGNAMARSRSRTTAASSWRSCCRSLFGMLLSVAIVTGGQYLLQGVSEEKESRILESLLCTVSPDDLLVGKLLGLGGAGLTLVGVWIARGLSSSARPPRSRS